MTRLEAIEARVRASTREHGEGLGRSMRIGEIVRLDGVALGTVLAIIEPNLPPRDRAESLSLEIGAKLIPGVDFGARRLEETYLVIEPPIGRRKYPRLHWRSSKGLDVWSW